jgi:UDP-glucose 4-epimerase
MKIALIGGAGFLGSALAPYLKKAKKEVIVFGRKKRPAHLSSFIKYIQSDCSDPVLLHQQLTDVEEIIDFSYTTTPKTSFDDPTSDLVSNLTRVVSLLEACRGLLYLRKFIVISSGGTVYGKTGNYSITENETTNPISPYGITKLTTEKYAHMYRELYDLPLIIVRPSNVYGKKTEIDASQNFINVSLSQTLLSETISVYGSNGTVRDYLYLSDVSEALMSVLEFGVIGKIYNVGTGIGLNNIELLAMISDIVKQDGYSVKYRTCESRAFDVPFNVLNSSLLFNDTGWKSKTSIMEGLGKTWEHLKASRK